MSFPKRFLTCCQIHWNGWYFLFSPLILLPLLLLKPEMEYRALFIILWAFVWYFVEVPAVAATACLPIIFLPILGVMESNQICMHFTRDSNMLFLCCNFIAVALQHSNLAQRQGFLFLRYLSADPKKILLILMAAAYLFTCFLPAAYVCAVMMPTIAAILKYLDEAGVCKAVNEEVVLNDDEAPYPSAVANAFYIGVAYAINIGSMAAPLASESSIVLRELITSDARLGNLKSSFVGNYFIYSVPVSLSLLIFTMFYLHLIFIGRKGSDRDASEIDFEALKEKLPDFNSHMFCVISLFICSVVGVIIGSYLSPAVNYKSINFSAHAMMLCFLYFVLPNNFEFCNYFKCSAPKEYGTVPSILPWAPVHKIVPWKTFFVYGSSSVFGIVAKTVNLHKFAGDNLLDIGSKIAQRMGFIGLATLLTIMCSNTFVADMMLNICAISGSYSRAGILLYSITWASCLTFFLPVSSCGNCFAFGWGNVRTKDMILAAVGPTLFGLIVIFIMNISL